MKAYASLRKMILEGEVKLGVFYLEHELARRLGISRTPLKEALVKLENEGLISIQPRHGMQVRPISAKDMAEIYQVIGSLECEAVSIIANKGLEPAHIETLEHSIREMEEALDLDDLGAWASADERFHQLLLALCDNKRLQQTVLTFWDQSHRVRYSTLNLREKPVNSTNDHRAVVEAIKRGDAALAAEIHKQHRIAGGEAIVSILRSLGGL